MSFRKLLTYYVLSNNVKTNKASLMALNTSNANTQKKKLYYPLSMNIPGRTTSDNVSEAKQVFTYWAEYLWGSLL